MAIQFSVYLNSIYESKELFFFENDKKESFEECIIPEFKELIDLSISCESNVLLKVEGIDLVNDMNELENEWWEINDDKIYLYSINHQMDEPLIPGYYQVLLQQDSKIYYSWFKILPKNMSIAEWELMRNEIENEVKGLSLDLKYRNPGVQYDKSYDSSNHILFNKISLLDSELNNFVRVINQIILNPKYRISKEYSWDFKGKKFEIDQQTIKQMSKHLDKKNYIYSGKRFIDYNISYNQDLVLNLKKINRLLIKMKNSLFNYIKISRDKKEIEFLMESLIIVKKYSQLINKMLSQPWIENVDNLRGQSTSLNLIKDYKYNYINQFYQKLINNKPNLYLDSNYQLYWKNSALLYEIWGYLKIILILKDAEFVPKSGWLFDSNRLEIPFLKDGTTVVFEKDNIRLNVVYNKMIPNDNDGENIDNPIYMKKKNNKPDIRIDIYKNNSYYRSIIMDTKYRNFNSLWEKDEKVRTQLRNYKDSIKSKILYKNSPIERYATLFDSNPVSEVWVLFPKSGNSIKEKKIHVDEKISFKEFSPTKDIESVKIELITLIDKLTNIDSEV